MLAPDRGEQFGPGKLRSLGDVLKLEGQAFLQAMYSLENLMGFAGMAHEKRDDDYLFHMVQNYVEKAKPFSELLDQIGLRMSAIAVRKLVMISDLNGPNFGTSGYYRAIEQAALQAHGRIIDEVDLIHLYAVSGQNADCLEGGARAFGDGVLITFPESIYDLDEAATCLGMRRNTAAVFHLMRAIEATLERICDKLGATHKNKHGEPLTWGVLIANISDKLSGLESAKRSNWDELVANLNAVRLAWRNDTMHPVKKYTDDESRAIFEITRVFMMSAVPLVE